MRVCALAGLLSPNHVTTRNKILVIVFILVGPTYFLST